MISQKSKFTTIRIMRAAMIAAIYSVITIVFGPLSYGPVQIRFAEAFTLLPLLFPEAIIGVTVGCLISNIFTGMWTDMVFGTLATFCAAVLTYYIGRLLGLGTQSKKKSFADGGQAENNIAVKQKKAGVFLAAIPPVLINALVVPIIIFQFIQEDMANINIFASNNIVLYLLGFVSVFIGQAIAVYGIGVPLYYGIKKSMGIYANHAAEIKTSEKI